LLETSKPVSLCATDEYRDGLSFFGMSIMFVLPAAIGTFLLVNVVCAVVALGVGFAAGVWFFGAKMAKPAPKPPAKKPSPKQEDAKRATERAAMAAGRVADLAKNVASDVGDHAAKIQAITADLQGIDRDSAEANAAVLSAMDQMLSANAELQQRLESAEKQLAAQAVEIKAHESEARTDSLTTLANRRAFDDELKRRHSEWQRKGTQCTLVMLDIDFFKKFNDTHGHQVGDEVLRLVARRIEALVRARDTAVRYGGDEFVVLLDRTADPALITARALAMVDRVSQPFRIGEISDAIGVNVGVAIHPRDGRTEQGLLAIADRNMYRAKQSEQPCCIDPGPLARDRQP